MTAFNLEGNNSLVTVLGKTQGVGVGIGEKPKLKIVVFGYGKFAEAVVNFLRQLIVFIYI